MFVLSKLLSAITHPLFWVGSAWALGLAALTVPSWRRRWQRPALALLWAGLLVLGLLGFQAGPDALLRQLESQHTPPDAKTIERHVGVIVLGGALQHPASFVAHGQVPLGESAERMTAPLPLMRSHPHMRLVFAGGEGRLHTTGITEAELAARFYAEQGLPAERLVLEGGSRNTRENAQRVAALLGPECRQPWLLVTSAWHMPRSVAEFQAVGCNITPYPVDYRTGHSTPLTEYSLAQSLLRWQTALHEWLGIWVMRVVRAQ